MEMLTSRSPAPHRPSVLQISLSTQSHAASPAEGSAPSRLLEATRRSGSAEATAIDCHKQVPRSTMDATAVEHACSLGRVARDGDG